MKRMSFVFGISFVLALVSCVIAGHAYEIGNPPSDAEIAEAYVVDRFGEGDYEIEFTEECDNRGCTWFTVSDGEIVYHMGINMDYYKDLVE